MKINQVSFDNAIIIRPMHAIDIKVIAIDRCPPWTTVQETRKKWNAYYKEQQSAIRTIGIIEQNSEIVGYGSLLLKSQYPYFYGIPEIHDVWIYKEYRERGLGSRLINWLEALAKEKGYKEIGIGVGLYADYGAAQRLYVRLGYLPDGHGITYKYQSTVPGEPYPLDDDLILWLKKDL
ncbi:GNAT family N-acetyltransferase [Candidatus Protochlamydia phocaeensis]|uniref:GNAT family N-acetyltransferase n=1 Tax=Candidatus Protochlamydia phocaeensis TaxID=1414722 RepID=UPI0008382D8E|nr:GNAT family N-acetyltransferase [Candidatus Protochlamydia phocaeensis]